MAEFGGHQFGHYIQNAETINNFAAPPAPNHRELGLAALSAFQYGRAIEHFENALDNRPEAGTYYYAALASLNGTRPCRHLRATVERADSLLRHGGRTPESLVLRALLADDYTQAWRNHGGVPPAILRAISNITTTHRNEIIKHVPAPESRVWIALQSRRT